MDKFIKIELTEILLKCSKLNNFNTWLKLDDFDNNDEIDSYINQEIQLCEASINYINDYLDDFEDDDFINMDTLSNEVINNLIEAADEGELDLFPYFDDWESSLICLQTIWELTTSKKFPINF